MADTKISALTSGNPAQSTDEIPIARSGANFKITAGSVAALAVAGSTTQLQYNNAGSFGGISGVTSNGTAVTFSSGNLKLAGSSSGTTTLNAAAVAGTTTVTLPASTGTAALTNAAASTVFLANQFGAF